MKIQEQTHEAVLQETRNATSRGCADRELWDWRQITYWIVRDGIHDCVAVTTDRQIRELAGRLMWQL